jgi:hypothetical protein
MKKTNAIVFAQDKKTVVATRNGNECYLAHAVYEANKALIEELGGTRRVGVKYFCVDFPSVKKATAFVEEGIVEIGKKEYNATRKAKGNKNSKSASEGNKKPTSKAKGNKKSDIVTLVDAEGNEYKVPASALAQVKKPARKAKGDVAPTKSATKVSKETKKPARKSKGNAPELTEAGIKALDRMKMSVLNRAASAYSIAKGGEATTFSALGKSAKDLSAYMPKAKEALLKSEKWAKASKTHGLTEEMLG